MAIKNTCPSCKKGFTAPEDYLGKKVDCPRCGNKVLLSSPEEIQRSLDAAKEIQRQREDDQERLALIERMEVRRRRPRSYHESFDVSAGAVRHFNPAAPSRFLRMRTVSEALALLAYLEVLLAVLGMGLTVFLKLEDVISSIPLMLIALIAWAVVGSALFVGLKFLSELAFLLSDVGDQQHDVVQLLLDLRENTESRIEP
jgi:DNA-directed RNA polymerase subunit RPC12/RpoP